MKNLECWFLIGKASNYNVDPTIHLKKQAIYPLD